MSGAIGRDSYDLTSGLRHRLSDGVSPEPVGDAISELQRLAREHLGDTVRIRSGEGAGAIDIRVRAWSVGRIRRSARTTKR
ncbi:MAG: hypothetical protein U0V56_03055 [Actinomycetota bacterium]